MGTESPESRVDTPRDLFRVSPDPVLVADPATLSVVDASPAAAELLGVDRADLADRSVATLAPSDDESAGGDLRTEFTGAVERGENRFECRLERSDGASLRVDASVSRAAVGGTERLVAFLRDVTDRRERTAELRSSKEALQRLHEITIEDTDADTAVERILDTGSEFLGVDFAYVTEIDEGTQVIRHAVGHGEGLEIGDEAAIEETYCEHTHAGEDDGAVRAVRDVGETAWADSAAVDRFDLGSYLGTALLVGGEQVGTVCFAATEPRAEPFTEPERMFVDVAARLLGSTLERERREERLAEQRRQLRAAFNAPRSFIGVLDVDGTLLQANETAWKFVDRDPEEFVGRKFWDGPWWDHSPTLQRQVEDAVERARDGATVEFEATHVAATGDRIDADVTFRPVTDDGEVEAIVAQGVDVTERNRREQRLERQNQRLRTLLDNAPLVMFALDDDGVFQQSEGQALSKLGFEQGEVDGHHLEAVFGDNHEIVDMTDRALDGEEVEATLSVQDRWFRAWLRPIFDGAGEVSRVVGVSVDITEQKRREEQVEAINEATRRLSYATSPSEVAETIVDIADGTLDHSLTVVRRHDEETGALEPLATNEALVETLEDAGIEEVPEIPDDGIEKRIFERGETQLLTDYSERTDAVVATDVDLDSVLVRPLDGFGTLHVGTRPGESFGETDVTLLDILARNAVAALSRAEREAELQATKEELERSNERLQEFAYIASHDLQEPLRMVSSYVDLLAMEYGDRLDEEADQYIEFAVDGARRMQSMIDALLTYSRVHTRGEGVTEFDTEPLVAEVIRDLELLIEESDADVTVESLPRVTADRDQLGQVFRNLIKNAIDHTGSSPTVTVSGERVEDGYRFSVADDGPGVPENQQDMIFEIFKRGGNSTGDGTGIGLAVCKRIVTRHGGDIWIESAEGEGASFVFTIPDDAAGEVAR